MRILPILVVLVIALTACTRTNPVYNVTDRALPAAAENMSLEQIGDAIAAAPKDTRWSLKKVSSGVIEGEYTKRRHYAKIIVQYNKKTFSILYSGSRHLLADGSGIHKNYNIWVKQLEDDISASIAEAAARKGASP